MPCFTLGLPDSKWQNWEDLTCNSGVFLPPQRRHAGDIFLQSLYLQAPLTTPTFSKSTLMYGYLPWIVVLPLFMLVQFCTIYLPDSSVCSISRFHQVSDLWWVQAAKYWRVDCNETQLGRIALLRLNWPVIAPHVGMMEPGSHSISPVLFAYTEVQGMAQDLLDLPVHTVTAHCKKLFVICALLSIEIKSIDSNWLPTTKIKWKGNWLPCPPLIECHSSSPLKLFSSTLVYHS